MSEHYTIVAEKLVKKYGDIVAVAGVDLRVRKGEIFGLLGPNGAGKTTIVHILSTIIKPTSGRAIVAGHDVVKEPDKVRKRIGVVFQDITLDLNLTAYENLWIHGKVYGVSSHELKQKIWKVLDFVGLREHANRLVKHFSGGMKRRLEIARALLHEPEVLFLDEPTLGLDPHARANVWDYIKRMREEYSVTIFLTTHYLDEAEQLCDRVAIIDRGKVIAEGSPEELKSMLGSDIVIVRASNIDQAVKVLSNITDVRDVRHLQDGRIELTVREASKIIPLIIEELHRRGVQVLEISYRRPTLNEVFLHLTGRELRESEETSIDIVRRMFLRRVR